MFTANVCMREDNYIKRSSSANCRNCSDLAVDGTRCAVAGHDNCQQTAVAPLCGGARRDSGGH